MNWEAIFFDFDGVILDSVDVKTHAFATMFRPYGPEVEQAVVDYHLANGGKSRFEKFRYYYQNLLKKPITEDALEALGREFSQLALEGVLAAPFIDGALETLKQLKKKGIPAFVASGTPNDEIQLIVEKRGLSAYFMEVHGAPLRKQEIVADVCQRHGLEPRRCLFIGDALTDCDAAKSSGTEFLGIVKEDEQSPFPESTLISPKIWINENLI